MRSRIGGGFGVDCVYFFGGIRFVLIFYFLVKYFGRSGWGLDRERKVIVFTFWKG